MRLAPAFPLDSICIICNNVAMENPLELNERLRREAVRELYDLCIEQMRQMTERGDTEVQEVSPDRK